MTNASAPINSSTQAQLETQGLTGSGVVALRGGDTAGATELEGNPPIIPSLPTATLADIQTKAGYVLDLANKLLVDNSEPIHRTLENVQNFSQALARNSDGVDAALQSVTDLGKAIQPLATRLQSLADHADTVVAAIDPAQVHAIVTSVEQATSNANATIDQVSKLIADNNVAIRSTLENVDAFTRMLNDNRDNVQTTLQGAADIGRAAKPLAAQLQTLTENANRVVGAVDAQQVRSVIADVQKFTQALGESSADYKKLLADGAGFVGTLNSASEQISSAVTNIDAILKAVQPQKVSGIVNSVNGFAMTLSDNRPNVDEALRNANEITAKLNKSADKVDGVLTSAQNFLGSPGTQGAVQQIGDAAQSIKKLADNLDSHVKEIATGLTRFSNSGLRQYEALAVQGQRVLDDVDRVVRSFERNPGQLIWGSRPPLPEYRGQQ